MDVREESLQQADRSAPGDGDRESRFAVIAAGSVVVLIVMALLVFSLDRGEVTRPRDSGPAPDFTLTGFDGESISLEDLRGQVVVINFWASWCLPCRTEAEYLQSTWERYRDRPVVFIGIDYKDTEEAARAFLDEFGITYFNGPDVGARISQDYRVQAVPETFFVGKDGRLRGVKLGPLSPPELERRIEELLAEPYGGTTTANPPVE